MIKVDQKEQALAQIKKKKYYQQYQSEAKLKGLDIYCWYLF